MGEGGGDSDSITVFHVRLSSLWPMVVSHRLGSFSGSEKQEGSMGVFFGIYADGALLLLEF